MNALMQVIVSGVLAGGLYALASTGLTLTYGVLRVVNFAHGEFIMLGMYAAWVMQDRFGLDPYLSIPVSVGAAAVVAWITYQLAVRRTLQAAHAVQAFVTLGLSLLMINLALVVFGGERRTVSSFLQGETLQLGTLRFPMTRVVSFVAALVVGVALWLWMQRTDFGKAIRATIQNRDVAQLMGIDVDRLMMVTFVVGTGLAGLAGALFAPIYAVYPTTGLQTILIAFVVVVLGGMGSVPGAIIAGLIIGVVESVSAYYLGTESRQIIYFGVFVLVLVLFPSGILGIRGSEEVGYK